MKKCIKCQAFKPYSEFHKSNQRKDGYRTTCKECRKPIGKEYYQSHKDERNKKAKLWREQSGYNKKYYKKNPNYFENYRKLKENHYKNWRKENKEYLKNYRKEKLRTDINYRISCHIRGSVNSVIRKYKRKKCDSTMKLLGCSIKELKSHLESKFKNGMNWDNKGFYGWHIDHIKPCSSFDLTKESEQRKCFHYTNLQPLWAKDNLVKGNRWW